MTGTDLLIDVMERFAESEPTAVLVAWTNEGGSIHIRANCSSTLSIGLAESAKAGIVRDMFPPGGAR